MTLGFAIGVGIVLEYWDSRILMFWDSTHVFFIFGDESCASTHVL